MKFLLIYFLIILFELTITKEARQPKLFKIDLDKQPRERWKSVIEKYKDNVIPEIAGMARLKKGKINNLSLKYTQILYSNKFTISNIWVFC